LRNVGTFAVIGSTLGRSEITPANSRSTVIAMNMDSASVSLVP
jgi:hypothetical protein